MVLAVGAADASESFLQIAALEKRRHRLFDDRPPIAIPGLMTLVADLLEEVKVLIEQPPQIRR